MPDDATFGARLAATVDPARDARGLWADLGRAGLIREMFGRDPSAVTTDLATVETLVTTLDAVLPLGMVMSVGVQVCASIPLLLSTVGTNSMVEPILADVLDGRTIVCVATAEPGVSGSAVLTTNTGVSHDADRIVVRGAKSWVTNGLYADYVMVLLHDLPGRGLLGMSWVLVPLHAPHVALAPSTTEWFAGSGLADIHFDGVELAEDHLGKPRGRAVSLMAACSASERVMMALWARSLSRRVLRDTRDRLRGRTSVEGVLWDNPVVQSRYSALVLQWRGLDALCLRERWAPSDPRGRMALKATAARTAASIVAGCLDLLGSDAFRDGGLARLAAEVGVFATLGGATVALETSLASNAAQLLRGFDDDPPPA